LTKMLQMLTEPQPFKWFYDRFGLFVLPLLALFWTGVARRLADYGLTESRYYLLFGGALMTACVLVFLFRNRRGYFTLAVGSLVVVLLTVLVPPLRGERIAQRAQIHRVRTVAKQLDRLNDDGTLRLPEPDPTDTLNMEEHRRLYQSLDYIGDNDMLVLKQEFGLSSPKAYLETLSELTRNYASAWSEERAEEVVVEESEEWVNLLYNDERPLDIRGYSRVYAERVGWWVQDTDETAVKVGQCINIPIKQIWAEQMQKYGFTDQEPTEEWLKAHENELLVYQTDNVLVVFSQMKLKRYGEGSWCVDEVWVSFVMEK